ncbi:hypothetical protein [Ruegeria sp.]
MKAKTLMHYAAGTMVGIFLYEVLDNSGLTDRLVQSVSRMISR